MPMDQRTSGVHSCSAAGTNEIKKYIAEARRVSGGLNLIQWHTNSSRKTKGI